jgi:hypothetical protein
MTAPAAMVETDLRKSRRFMGCSNASERALGADFARFVPKLNGTLPRA